MKNLFIAAVLVAGTAACSDPSSPATVVTSSVVVAPTPGAAGVARGDTIRMWLDLPMDSAWCATRFVLHRGDSLGPMVPGRTRLADGYRQMMFVPDSLLAPGTRYFAHLRDSLMTREGWGGGMMGGSRMDGPRRMMIGDMPAGAVRVGGGVGWAFTTAQ